MNIGRMIIIGGEPTFTIHVVINSPVFFVGICFDMTNAHKAVEKYSNFMLPRDVRMAHERIEESGMPMTDFDNQPMVFELSPGKELAYAFNSYFEAHYQSKVFTDNEMYSPVGVFEPGSFVTCFPDPSEWILKSPNQVNFFSSCLLIAETDRIVQMYILYSKAQWRRMLSEDEFICENEKEKIYRGIAEALLPEESDMPMKKLDGIIPFYLFMASRHYLNVDTMVRGFGSFDWRKIQNKASALN